MPATSEEFEILEVTMRAVKRTDIPFIYDAWLESYKRTVAPSGDGRAARYYKEQRLRLDMLRDRGVWMVATDPHDADYLMGFVCAEPPLIHYLYVKPAFRRQGIARSLIAAAGLAAQPTLLATHWTSFADKLAITHPRILQYVGTDVPFFMRKFYEHRSEK